VEGIRFLVFPLSKGELKGVSPTQMIQTIKNMSKIGVGIIGTGFGQLIHIPALQIHPDTEVVAVYHRDRLKAQQIADKFAIPHACDRLEDLFALPEVQAVTISTPPSFHYEQAKAAIEAGKHVLLEKPVTMNFQEAIALYRLAQERQVITATDFEFRCVPQWRYFKHLLDHDANGVMRLVDADDTCNILLELADGTPCNISLSTVTYRGRGHWLTGYGENGTLVLGSSNQSDYVHGFSLRQGKIDRTEMEIVPIPPEYDLPKTYADGRLAPVLAICDRWVQSIQTGQPMTPSLYEGAWSQLLMDLTQESHQQKKWIDVPSSL